MVELGPVHGSDESIRSVLAGRYRLGDLLGQGGAGQVHAAWDLHLGRPVAIKRVEVRPESDGLREAQLTAGLRHPAFVTVYEAWREGRNAYIAMECVPGLTLKAWLAQHGAASAVQACAWMQQLALAMANAHAKGLVHGDLKPSNLMLEAEGERLRVLDLGIARVLDPLTTRSHDDGLGGSGTLAYMAPEQLRGQTSSVATDIYALGLVLLAALQGGSPDSGRLGLQAAWRRMQGEVMWDSALQQSSAPLNDLLAKLLAPEPAQRPRNMSDVAAALGKVMAALQAAVPAGGRAIQSVRGAPLPAFTFDWRRQFSVHAGRLSSWSRMALALAGVLTLFAAFGSMVQQSSSSSAPPAVWLLSQLVEAETALRDFDDPDRLNSALRQLQTVTERAPRHASSAALRALAAALTYSQQRGNAAALVEADRWSATAIGLDPQLALAHASRGLFESLSAQDKLAEASFQKSLMLDPQNLHALVWLADLWQSQHRYEEAMALLQRAERLHPQERQVHDLLGTLAFQRADYIAAEAAFRRSIELHPSGSVGYLSLSGVLLSMQRLDEAQAWLQRGLAVRPDPRLYTNLGVILAQRGKWAEAVSAQQRAVAIWPAGQPEAAVQANLAEALSRVPGRQADARAAWTRALRSAEGLWAQQTGNPELASQVGLFAAQLGREELARSATLRALTMAPEMPYVLVQAATAWALLGDLGAARPLLAQAISRGYPVSMAAQEPALVKLLPQTAQSDSSASDAHAAPVAAFISSPSP